MFDLHTTRKKGAGRGYFIISPPLQKDSYGLAGNSWPGRPPERGEQCFPSCQSLDARSGKKYRHARARSLIKVSRASEHFGQQNFTVHPFPFSFFLSKRTLRWFSIEPEGRESSAPSNPFNHGLRHRASWDKIRPSLGRGLVRRSRIKSASNRRTS